MKKQKIEKRPTRARRAVKSVVIMFCALLICNMLSGGHLTRAMALRDGEQRYGVYEKTHEITSLPAENIYKTLRVTLMASENVTYCGASLSTPCLAGRTISVCRLTAQTVRAFTRAGGIWRATAS